MKTPLPIRTFTITALIVAALASIFAGFYGWTLETYRVVGTGIEFLEPTTRERLINILRYAGVTLPLAWVGIFLVLCVVRWAWYFLLDRVTEIAAAAKAR